MCNHALIENKIHKSQIEIDVLWLEKEDCVYLECRIHGSEDCECDSLCGSCRYLDEDTIWSVFDDLNTSNMWMLMRN